MPKILIEKDHNMGAEKAKAAIIDTFSKNTDEFDLDADWKGTKCILHGAGGNGSIVVKNDTVVFDLNLTILLRTQGLTTEVVENAIEELLDKALGIKKE